jgi:subtilisin family serine protease
MPGITRALAPALLCILALAGTARADLSPELADRLATAGPGERIPVIATLRAQVEAPDYAGRPAALIRALRATAARTQDGPADDLNVPVRRFWLVNALGAQATPAEVRALADDPAVERVALDLPVRAAEAVGSEADVQATPFPDAGAGDWGLDAIGARSVWSAYGLTGAGVRVGSIDTGVNAAHPDLAGKVVGWRDFVNGRPAPYDDNGHGTHTVGTMVGGSAGGSPIGVAPGARVVVAKAMNANGVGAGSNLLAAAQWMTDPDGNPATADYPSVINGSWTTGDANDPWFRDMVRQWIALGIVPVFAAGNGGPGAGTVGSPASYPESVAVGAIDQSPALAAFSARGPILWRDLDGSGPAPGTVITKPDLVAPGVGITSSVGSGYLAYSGTSMASPHVAGVVALMRQAAPDLGALQVEDILRRTATPAAGDPGGWGAGEVDAPAAVRAAGAAPLALAPSAAAPVSATPDAARRVASPARRATPRLIGGRVRRSVPLRTHALVLRGRLTAPARIAVTLEPTGRRRRALHRRPLGRPHAVRAGAVRLGVPLRRPSPGAYRLVVRLTRVDGTAPRIAARLPLRVTR